MAIATKALRSALAFGAFASVAITLPAHAAPTPCVGAYSAAQIFTGSFECIAGDKIYSNFVNVSGNLPGNFFVSIVDADPFHTLSTLGTFSGGGAGTTYAMSYRVAVDPLISNRSISTFSTDFTLTSGTGNIKTLTATNPPAGTATATRTNGIAPAPPVVIPGGASQVDFISTLFVSNSNLATGYSDTVFQIDPTRVPGPLPILGAAAAFGYSRKLRRRIKQTV